MKMNLPPMTTCLPVGVADAHRRPANHPRVLLVQAFGCNGIGAVVGAPGFVAAAAVLASLAARRLDERHTVIKLSRSILAYMANPYKGNTIHDGAE